MKITPVILAGGFGTRLWPISRKSKPKQFSIYIDGKSLFQNTILRFNNTNFSSPVIICNEEHRFMVASQLEDINISPQAIILEPSSQNTAPAISSVAHFIASFDPHQIMLVCPADHLIRDNKKFVDEILKISELALQNFLITFGIKPKSPETGFGYILKSKSIENTGAFKVAKFVEKPIKKNAIKFLRNPNYFWNSGIFLFTAQTFLENLKELNIEIFKNTQNAFEKSCKDLDFTRLDKISYEKCQNISVDYAIMEKAKNIALMPINLEWSDIGSWQAIYNNGHKDINNNFIEGKVVTYNASNCYIKSESSLIACMGIKDLVVVASKDAILIANINDSQNIKEMFDLVKNSYKEYCLNHRVFFRPWGSFEIIDDGDNFKVKKIIVNPKSSLSLQSHNHRAEHWVVVRGEASITCEEKHFTLTQNQSTFIPVGFKHRLENKTDETLEIIEIQSGNYLEEDDIQRFSDNYGRKNDNL